MRPVRRPIGRAQPLPDLRRSPKSRSGNSSVFIELQPQQHPFRGRVVAQFKIIVWAAVIPLPNATKIRERLDVGDDLVSLLMSLKHSLANWTQCPICQSFRNSNITAV
jgi:hypothetical protein